MRPVYEQLTLNTDLLPNCIADLSEEDWARRPTDSTNSIAFLAAHLADARYFLAGLIGAPKDNPLTAFENVNSIDKIEGPLPSIEELLGIWKEISTHLAGSLEKMKGDELGPESEIPFPINDRTVRGCVTFLLHHDTYHIGQIAILRKQFGYPAMKYDRPGSDS